MRLQFVVRRRVDLHTSCGNKKKLKYKETNIFLQFRVGHICFSLFIVVGIYL